MITIKTVHHRFVKSTLILLGVLSLGSISQADPLKVCATTPDLGALVKAVGGEDVSVVVFTKGLQDPHFLEAKPSFVKDLFRADLYIQVGLDLESGWAPVILKKARNPSVNLGGKGF